MMKPYDIYHVGISGGKDSAATLLWAVHSSGWPREKIRATFCDTQNEHEFTYQYVKMLSDRVHPIETIRADLGFYELAQKKKRFPSIRARFCTQYLKIFVTQKYIKAIQESGKSVLLVSGVRRNESLSRAELPLFEYDEYYQADQFRPLLIWSLDDVWAFLATFGISRNPLYEYGANRVGCFPCFNSTKHEIRTIAKHFPERIDFIREQEGDTGHTFFARDKVPERFRSKEFVTEDGEVLYVPTIDDVVAWAKTPLYDRVGQYEMDFASPSVCNSNLGVCE